MSLSEPDILTPTAPDADFLGENGDRPFCASIDRDKEGSYL